MVGRVFWIPAVIVVDVVAILIVASANHLRFAPPWEETRDLTDNAIIVAEHSGPSGMPDKPWFDGAKASNGYASQSETMDEFRNA